MKKIVIFDGDCPFCNRSVMWLAEMDTDNDFLFVSNLSQKGREILNRHHLERVTLDSIIVWVEGRFYTKAKAIAVYLTETNKWPVLQFILKITPSCISNFLYDMVASVRKKIIRNSCALPEQKIRTKFIIQ
ncbi:DUF393 domain-containing protein [Rapidithrix thailandica]|uniref:DUF393 domain-containing protein n=1 Tax=Rapidithrix thailandica TaxID=413964 RepID=A0AAW9RXN1_9BACT